MPKMKSHRGAAKRFKVTGSGKIKRKRAFKNHILTKKSSKTIRSLRKDGLVHKSDEARVKRMIVQK